MERGKNALERILHINTHTEFINILKAFPSSPTNVHGMDRSRNAAGKEPRQPDSRGQRTTRPPPMKASCPSHPRRGAGGPGGMRGWGWGPRGRASVPFPPPSWKPHSPARRLHGISGRHMGPQGKQCVRGGAEDKAQGQLDAEGPITGRRWCATKHTGPRGSFPRARGGAGAVAGGQRGGG